MARKLLFRHYQTWDSLFCHPANGIRPSVIFKRDAPAECPGPVYVPCFDFDFFSLFPFPFYPSPIPVRTLSCSVRTTRTGRERRNGGERDAARQRGGRLRRGRLPWPAHRGRPDSPARGQVSPARGQQAGRRRRRRLPVLPTAAAPTRPRRDLTGRPHSPTQPGVMTPPSPPCFSKCWMDNLPDLIQGYVFLLL